MLNHVLKSKTPYPRYTWARDTLSRNYATPKLVAIAYFGLPQ
ncbi:hypothetical protein [Nostoc sp. WHI]|nr:hypothetical protein [Nostoc sp. WHI]